MPPCPPLPNTLVADPENSHRGRTSGLPATYQILIPHYRKKVEDHCGHPTGGPGFPCPFDHFGLQITFDQETELDAFDTGYVLDPQIKDMVARFGVVYFKSAHLSPTERKEVQKNIFTNLAFHYDRHEKQGNFYSFFTRNPFSKAQGGPRTSSTLFCSNLVAYTQAIKEGVAPHDTIKSLYNLYQKESHVPLVGNVLLELKWDTPKGSGEICVFDNRTILHASYYPHPSLKGYPIGVRYLY